MTASASNIGCVGRYSDAFVRMTDLPDDRAAADVQTLGQLFDERSDSVHEHAVAVAIELVAVIPPQGRQLVGAGGPIVA